ncbi:hypothetical protein ABMA32_19050 [Mesorhizobium sp. VNQ89]|uniref:hypothetical protein n=1 Tax=Mesorhizobium quangtriensis TaxID=3157709 RepID=UPI0032B7F185
MLQQKRAELRVIAAAKAAFERRFSMDNQHDAKRNDDDDEGVIVAGPDARARARGEKKDDAKARNGRKKHEESKTPTRDTRDSPAENPKTAADGELPIKHDGH